MEPTNMRPTEESILPGLKRRGGGALLETGGGISKAPSLQEGIPPENSLQVVEDRTIKK